jgi:hypothetical protein
VAGEVIYSGLGFSSAVISSSNEPYSRGVFTPDISSLVKEVGTVFYAIKISFSGISLALAELQLLSTLTIDQALSLYSSIFSRLLPATKVIEAEDWLSLRRF